MPARKTPSKGGKPDKLMRDALMLELNEAIKVAGPDGKAILIRRYRLVARALIAAALNQDVPAIKEIFERVDGKLPTPIRGDGPGGAIPINISNLSTEQLEQMKERLAAGLGLATK